MRSNGRFKKIVLLYRCTDQSNGVPILCLQELKACPLEEDLNRVVFVSFGSLGRTDSTALLLICRVDKGVRTADFRRV